MSRKTPNRSSKLKKTGKSFILLSIGYIALLLWEVDIFRKTFISFFILLILFIVGGVIAFFLLRNKIPYYKRNRQTFGTPLLAVHGIILFGGIILFLFMALNFYVPISKTETLHLKVIKTGRFGSRRGAGDPYVIVDYHGFQKQLVFPHNTNMENNGLLQVSLRKGIFGFSVVKEMHLIAPDENQAEIELKRDEQRAYQKMIDRAEAYYSEGNLAKSIELYERAIGFRPSDTLTKNRLEEIKKSFH